jgi:proteasome lid subunit RPN8/RPN11
MKLSDQAVKDFTAHVLRDYPNEAVGLIINGSYRPCENIHPEPTKHFRIAAEEMVLSQAERVIETSSGQSGGKLEAILHSHPYNPTNLRGDGYRPEYPSASDIDHFNHWGIPWGIVATDGGGLSDFVWLDDNNRAPLYGRHFIWGVQDCFSLVRDWYKEVRGINLYNVPREWGWWHDKDSPQLFEEWFARVGFELIPTKQATIGDVALMRMGDRHSAGVINHCGVITNHNTLLHQGFGPFYSRDCRMDAWQKSIAKFIRYTAK